MGDGQGQGSKPAGAGAAGPPDRDTAPPADDARATPLVVTTQLGGIVFLVLAFWTVVALLPAAPLSVTSPMGAWLAYGVLAAVLLLAAVGLRFARSPGTRGSMSPFGTVTLALVVLLDVMMFLGFSGAVRFTPELRFTMAVGGGAVASFVFGMIVFSTIRVAASLPVVILFIGVATSPGGMLVDPEVRAELIRWMGIILGVSAAAEGATQAAKVIGHAQVSKTVAAASGGDPAQARALAKSLTPPEIGGDLQSTANGDPTFGEA